MGKIGCITLNGRKVFSVGRGIVSARGDLVIFSDGSSINLKTGVVTNLSPELLLSLDEIPAGYQVPEVPKPAEKRFQGRILSLVDIERTVIIEPHDSGEIVIPATLGIKSDLKQGVVTITPTENNPWANISISNVQGMRIGFNILSIVGSLLGGFNVLASGEDTSDLKIQVPYGTQINLKNCEDAVVGDTGGNVMVVSDDEVDLKVGRVEGVDVKASGDVSLVASKVTGVVRVASDGDVDVSNLHGCAGLTITASGDVDVVCGEIVGNVVVASDGDADVNLHHCSGNVKITSSGDTVLKAVEVIGNVTSVCEGDAQLSVDNCRGTMDVKADGEASVVSRTAMKNLKLTSGDDVSVSVRSLVGAITIAADGDLDLIVAGGDIGAVTLNVDGDASVSIKTIIDSIKAIVEGDGTFRVQGCSGFQRIKVEGDDDIEIG